MKVSSTSGPGLARTVMACVSIALAVAVGTSFVPVQSASASIDGPAHGLSGEPALGPVTEPQKTAEIREPSGLVAVEESAAAVRTPTRIRAKRSYRAAAPVASGAVSSPSGDGWLRARVSWYGPGFYGRGMAGGGTLQPDSMVVAHRSLPFGTRIEFSYNGRSCVAVVMDRGPYAGGRTFDLGPGTAATLGFSGVGTVEYRILN